VQARVARAMRDDAVKGVVFEMDSYGGEVAGALRRRA
jgi:ClpP class serine protease